MQEQWASFWEHLEDLRHTLLRSFLIIGVGFVILLGFYQPLLYFVSTYSLAHSEQELIHQHVQKTQVVNQTAQNQLFELPDHAWVISDLSSSTQKENRTLYSLVPGQTLIYEQIIASPLLIMGPIEGLLLVFKACFWLSVALTAPLWGWIWLQFILPGLKAQERVILLPFLFSSLFCIGIGMTLAYFFTLPLANQYLILFNHSLGQNAWTLTHYVNYVLLLCMGHAVAAELALLLLLLVHFRLLSASWLIQKRRYMIVVAFILGALLTPPDVLTQLLLAFPLIGIYEIAIWYAKWRNRISINH